MSKHSTTTSSPIAAAEGGRTMRKARKRFTVTSAAFATMGLTVGASALAVTVRDQVASGPGHVDFSTIASKPPQLIPAPAADNNSINCSGTAGCELWATTGTISVGGSAMTIWGYGKAAGAATIPGPIIVAAAGDHLKINLHNDLPTSLPTNVTIPGLPLAAVGPTTPTSFEFTVATPGTFTYEPGATIANGNRQIAMGLAGVVVVRPAAADCVVESGQLGCAYGAAALGASFQVAGSDKYNDEALIAINDFDPKLLQAVADKSTPIDKVAALNDFVMADLNPTIHLINGKAFPDTEPIEVLAGDAALLRYANLGPIDRTQAVLGAEQHIIARDGRVLPHAETEVAPLFTAGQTADVIVPISPNAKSGDHLPLSDQSRRLGQSAAKEINGALTFFNVWQVASVADQPVVSNLHIGPDGLYPDTDVADLTAPLEFGFDPLIDTASTVRYSIDQIGSYEGPVLDLTGTAATPSDPTTAMMHVFVNATAAPGRTVSGIQYAKVTGPGEPLGWTTLASGAITAVDNLASATWDIADVHADDTVFVRAVDSVGTPSDGKLTVAFSYSATVTSAVVPLTAAPGATLPAPTLDTTAASATSIDGVTASLNVNAVATADSGTTVATFETALSTDGVYETAIWGAPITATPTSIPNIAEESIVVSGVHAADTVFVRATDAQTPDALSAAAALTVVPHTNVAVTSTVSGVDANLAGNGGGAISMNRLTMLASGRHILWLQASNNNGAAWGDAVGVAFTVDKNGPMMRLTTVSPTRTNAVINGGRVTLRTTADTTSTGTAFVTDGRYVLDAPCPSDPTTVTTILNEDPVATLGTLRVQGFTADIDVSALSEGPHVLRTTAVDALGHWSLECDEVSFTVDRTGPVTGGGSADPAITDGTLGYAGNPQWQDSVWVEATVNDAANNGVNSTIARIEGFLTPNGANGSGFEFIPTDGAYDEQEETGYVLIPLATVRTLGFGVHAVYVHGLDSSGNWGNTSVATTIELSPLHATLTNPTSSANGNRTPGITVNVAATGLSGYTVRARTASSTGVAPAIGVDITAPSGQTPWGSVTTIDTPALNGVSKALTWPTNTSRTATLYVWVQDSQHHSLVFALPPVDATVVSATGTAAGGGGPGGGGGLRDVTVNLNAFGSTSIVPVTAVEWITGDGTNPPTGGGGAGAAWSNVDVVAVPALPSQTTAVTVDMLGVSQAENLFIRVTDALGGQRIVSLLTPATTITSASRSGSGNNRTFNMAMTASTGLPAVTIARVERAATTSGNAQPGGGGTNWSTQGISTNTSLGQPTVNKAITFTTAATNVVGWVRVTDSLAGQSIVNTVPTLTISSATRSVNNTATPTRTATITGTSTAPFAPVTYALAVVTSNQAPAANSASWITQGVATSPGTFSFTTGALGSGGKSIFLRVTDAAGASTVVRVTRTGGGGGGGNGTF